MMIPYNTMVSLAAGVGVGLALAARLFQQLAKSGSACGRHPFGASAFILIRHNDFGYVEVQNRAAR